jgi:hypothetical protein
MKDLMCIICGMKIDERNYIVNTEGILNKNNNDRIITCPFCGASHDYIKSDAEEITGGENYLDEVTLIILDHAMKLEVFNGEFYREASAIAEEKPIKDMFTALSRIEFMHARIHQKLGKFQKLPVLQKIDYSKFHSDSELLAEARKREEHAISYYAKYMEQVCDNNIKIIFSELSSVEREHIQLTFI